MTHIEPGTEPYYDRLTKDRAALYAREYIDEWSHKDDPHGYCHTRPMLLRLAEAAEELAELKAKMQALAEEYQREPRRLSSQAIGKMLQEWCE